MNSVLLHQTDSDCTDPDETMLTHGKSNMTSNFDLSSEEEEGSEALPTGKVLRDLNESMSSLIQHEL